jgi:hypothetical protein
MQGNFMQYMDIFGTRTPVVVSVDIPTKWQPRLINNMQILVFSFCLAYNLPFKIFPLFWIFGTVDTGCFLQHFWWHYSVINISQKYFIVTSFIQLHTFHKHSDIIRNRKWSATHSNCLEIFNDSTLIMLANKPTLAETMSSYSQWHNSVYFSVPYSGAL